jgi:hypothetical protein
MLLLPPYTKLPVVLLEQARRSPGGRSEKLKRI